LLLASLFAAGDPETLIALEVREYFRRYGIVVPEVPVIPHDAIEVPRDLTSDDKVVQWLERQVQPAIRKTIERVGLDRVLVALGLAHIGPDWLEEFKTGGF